MAPGSLNVAAELAVGDRLQAEIFLELDRLADVLVLDLLQLRIGQLAFAVLRAGLVQLLGTQQAADMVGTEWRLHLSSSGSYAACFDASPLSVASPVKAPASPQHLPPGFSPPVPRRRCSWPGSARRRGLNFRPWAAFGGGSHGREAAPSRRRCRR